MSDGAGSFVVQCLTIMCVHVWSFFFISFCVALGQESKIARNSVVEEVVWSVLPCISQSAFALKVRDGRMAPSFFLLRMAPGAAVEDSMKIKFVKVV